MTVGELEAAQRRALALFDHWNAVTGTPERGTSYYYEIQGLIEDAVHCGAQGATGDYRRLKAEPAAIFKAARGAARERPVETPAPKWIRFEKERSHPSRVTDIWTVYERDSSTAILGQVRWFGRWRCYAFEPSPSTVFERVCLEDIAAFCEAVTQAHRQALRERRRA